MHASDSNQLAYIAFKPAGPNRNRRADVLASQSLPTLGASSPATTAADAAIPAFGNTRDIADGPIVIGVCAMRKKAKSKPMNELLDRITAFTSAGISEFRVVFFNEDMILNAPVTEWPLCEALIAFFSTGFPLQKAAAYADLRRPLVFNDLSRQEMLFDRRMVYQILEESGVP
eukprot:7335676-Prymnesium_polylepis.1